jgi:DNA-binding response OmpR family regulator
MPKIIVAESNRLLSSAVSAYLRGVGYDVMEATDVPTTIACLRQTDVAAVLLDMYQNSSEIDLLRYIRSQPALTQTPVIALMTSDYQAESLDYLTPGDYLRVPFDMLFLDWVLQELLAKRAVIEEQPAILT